MNFEIIQNLQHKLQQRTNRLNSSLNPNSPIFSHSSVKQYWSFLNKYPVLVSILDELSCHFSNIKDKIDVKSRFDIFDTDSENSAACYFTLQQLVNLEDQEIINQSIYPYVLIDQFKYTYLTNLCEYIDEQLCDKRITLALLKRYKHKCEWFQRENLFKLRDNNSRKGEKLLASHLYEYLYDQGLDFTIEPYSVSGEVDLIDDKQGDNPFVAEAKYSEIRPISLIFLRDFIKSIDIY
jgi:hypothetical protein